MVPFPGDSLPSWDDFSKGKAILHLRSTPETKFYQSGAGCPARGRLSPPGALADPLCRRTTAFRSIWCRTWRRSNRNAVPTRVAGSSPLRTARRMVSVLTPIKAASYLIDRSDVFMHPPWFKVLPYPTPDIQSWELGRCTLMYAGVVILFLSCEQLWALFA